MLDGVIVDTHREYNVYSCFRRGAFQGGSSIQEGYPDFECNIALARKTSVSALYGYKHLTVPYWCLVRILAVCTKSSVSLVNVKQDPSGRLNPLILLLRLGARCDHQLAS